MKKIVKRVSALLMVSCMSLSLMACGGGQGKKGGIEEAVDTERTQLYVYNFAGGFGSDWLTALKKRYEEEHKDDVYEEGKKGVQIVINNTKTGGDAMQSQILYNKDEVYFTEYAYYYSMKNAGVLGDITEAITTDMAEYGDEKGTTIESKLTNEQKDFYGIEENGSTHYYALPHYAGYSGLIYNVDLFEQEKYYFADGVTDAQYLEDYFIVKSSDKRSTGPDGEYGTDDDGLPATFEEFFLLCDYIAERGHVPVSWLGASHDLYLRHLMLAAEANVEGVEQMMLNYSMNGVATSLGTVQGNKFVPDGKDTTITAKNGYEVFRQEGKYHALNLVQKLTTTDRYHNALSFNGGYSYLNAQEDFLYAGHDQGATKPIAMLVEGVWWENEATSVFETMSDTMGENFKKENRNFALMPLPKASVEDLGKNTLFDHIYSLCFMKSNIEEWKKPLAIDFIKFAYSNASLVEYSQVTNTPRALEYSMTEEQMKKMSPFGRSVMRLKQTSDVVYPFSKEPIYVNQSATYAPERIWTTKVGEVTYVGAGQAFHENGVTLAQYFEGLKIYNEEAWRFRQY